MQIGNSYFRIFESSKSRDVGHEDELGIWSEPKIKFTFLKGVNVGNWGCLTNFILFFDPEAALCQLL